MWPSPSGRRFFDPAGARRSQLSCIGHLTALRSLAAVSVVCPVVDLAGLPGSLEELILPASCGISFSSGPLIPGQVRSAVHLSHARLCRLHKRCVSRSSRLLMTVMVTVPCTWV